MLQDVKHWNVLKYFTRFLCIALIHETGRLTIHLGLISYKGDDVFGGIMCFSFHCRLLRLSLSKNTEYIAGADAGGRTCAKMVATGWQRGDVYTECFRADYAAVSFL